MKPQHALAFAVSLFNASAWGQVALPDGAGLERRQRRGAGGKTLGVACVRSQLLKGEYKR
jgi:hypothetical protein